MLSAYLTGGLVSMALKQVRGEPLRVADLFSGTESMLTITWKLFLWGTLGRNLLLPVLFFVLILSETDHMVIDLGDILPVFFMFLVIFTLIILGTLWMLADVFIVDTGASLFESLSQSKAVVATDFGGGLALTLITGLAVFAGMLPFGIGLVATIPLAVLVPVLVYRAFYPERFESSASSPRQSVR